MSIRGSKPKPTRLKILAGNPGKRKLRSDEPSPTAGVPDPPATLHPDIKAQWDKVGALLNGMGVLTKADGSALLLLARAAADFLTYSDAAPPGSDVLMSDEGNAYWNMAAAARDKAESRLLRMLVEFGLTPSSRTRVAAIKPKQNDGKSRFFRTTG